MKRKIKLLLAFLLLSISCAFAQKLTVKGTVLDETGQTIIGATVREKGVETNGTATNMDGQFTLTVNQGATLIVSYVGYKTQEVKAATQMSIKMTPDSELLDEVMVVAFGTAKKAAFTGSAVQLNSEDLTKAQTANVTSALAGKIPGVTVTSSNNQPGMGSSVRIRGIGSFSASSSPLYVVDGVPYSGDISSINSTDIASVTVLKDAASAALYGARGANGVILIQTKSGKGQQDRMSVTAEIRTGFNQRGVPEYDKVTDPKVYAAKYFEGLYNTNAYNKKDADPSTAMQAALGTYFSTDPKTANLVYHPFSSDLPHDKWFVKQPNGSFRMADGITLGTMLKDQSGKEYWLQPDSWPDEVFQTNPRYEANVSLSGRSEKANYFGSVGYLQDNGYTVASKFERFTSRLRADFHPTKWLTLGGNIAYTYYRSQSLSKTDEGGDSGNIFAMTDFIAPIYPVYVYGADKKPMVDKHGITVFDFGTSEYPGLTRPFLNMANPLALYLLDAHPSQASVVSARGYADFNIYEGLKATINFGYDIDDTWFTSKSNVYYGQFAKSGGTISKEVIRSTSLNSQQLLTYATAIGDHHVDALVGHEFYRTDGEDLWGSRKQNFHPDNMVLNGAITEKNNGNDYYIPYMTEGYLGRLQYDYDNRYFASLSYRRDASSRFAPGHRWGNFWSVGASWLLSEEAFMESTRSVVNLLKLKISYGMQGNDGIGSLRYMDLYSMKEVDGKYSTAFASKGNPDVTWETSGNLNAGIEWSLWKDRFTGSVDFYTREVTDMLFWRPTPRSGGYGGYYDNIGAMRNTGVDFQLAAKLIKTSDLEWTISLNGGYFSNKLTALPEEWVKDADDPAKRGHRDGRYVYRLGGSVYDRAFPHYTGVDESGKPTWEVTHDKDGKKLDKPIKSTDYKLANEEINQKIYTDLRPHLVGGFGTSLTYKGIDLAASFSYALGGRMFDGTYQSLMHGGNSDSSGNAWHKDILKSWTPENKNTAVPMVLYDGLYANSSSDRFFISRSYLAVNNVTLGYTLPSEWMEPIGLTRMRIYVVGDNLGVLSARKGLDPRFGAGIGYKAMRTVSLGLTLTM